MIHRGDSKPTTDDHLAKPITELGLLPRTAGALKRANILCVRDLVQRTDADLLKTTRSSRGSR